MYEYLRPAREQTIRLNTPNCNSDLKVRSHRMPYVELRDIAVCCGENERTNIRGRTVQCKLCPPHNAERLLFLPIYSCYSTERFHRSLSTSMVSCRLFGSGPYFFSTLSVTVDSSIFNVINSYCARSSCFLFYHSAHP